MKPLSILFSAVSLCAAAIAAIPVVSAQAQMSSGEIVKVDKEAAKITIKHGPLMNLKMPGMTMPFKVKDPAMLDQVKASDKVSFVAENVNGALTLTSLAAAK